MRAAGNLLIAFLFAALASGCRPDASPVPPGYPSSYASLITQARNEGVVTVYSVTDRVRMASLLSDFEKAYPGVTVRYVDLPAQGLFRRVVDEAESRSAGADVIWSSAMDLQVKLVNDGYAEKYASPESAALPEWAVWKEEAFGVTAEPIVFAYNRAAFADLPAPASHAELTAELERSPQRYHGKIITYDPESSAAGYLYLRQDEQASQDTWRLIRAMADANVELSPSTDRMLEALASGERLIAYNLIGSYAYDWARRHPAVEVVAPSDYTLVMSRIALISKNAPHPAAARLFLDFLLSTRGQQHIAAASMNPVRSDLPANGSFDLKIIPTRAIRVGPALLVNLDKLSRQQFYRKWHEVLEVASNEDSLLQATR